MPPPQDEPTEGLTDEWPRHLPAPRTATRLDDGWVGQTWVVTLDDARQVVVKRSPHPAAAEADDLAALQQRQSAIRAAANFTEQWLKAIS